MSGMQVFNNVESTPACSAQVPAGEDVAISPFKSVPSSKHSTRPANTVVVCVVVVEVVVVVVLVVAVTVVAVVVVLLVTVTVVSVVVVLVVAVTVVADVVVLLVTVTVVSVVVVLLVAVMVVADVVVLLVTVTVVSVVVVLVVAVTVVVEIVVVLVLVVLVGVVVGVVTSHVLKPSRVYASSMSLITSALPAHSPEVSSMASNLPSQNTVMSSAYPGPANSCAAALNAAATASQPVCTVKTSSTSSSTRSLQLTPPLLDRS